MAAYRLTGALRGCETGDVWIADGVITRTRPPGPVEDVPGVAYPGLVDAHAHPGLSHTAAPAGDAEVLRRLETARAAGVTAIREMGAQRDVAGLAAPGRPKVLRAGRHIARYKRYIRHLAVDVEPAELAGEALRQAARGDGWVKVVGDWIDRSEGADSDLRPLWPREALAEAVAAAHDAGARVALHAFAVETVDDALEAGVDCIEHGSGMTRDQMVEAAARGVLVDPTVCQVATFADIASRAGRYPVYRRRMLDMHARRVERLALMVETGTLFLMGTDTDGGDPTRTLPVEISAAVAAGMPAGVAMAAASYAGRRRLGLPAWQEGAPGDVVVYAADPEEEIAEVARPSRVFVDGVPVSGNADGAPGTLGGRSST